MHIVLVLQPVRIWRKEMCWGSEQSPDIHAQELRSQLGVAGQGRQLSGRRLAERLPCWVLPLLVLSHPLPAVIFVLCRGLRTSKVTGNCQAVVLSARRVILAAS